VSPATVLPVAVEAPQYTGLLRPLSYTSEQPLAPGTLVHVPLGKRRVPGVVWRGSAEVPENNELRPVAAHLTRLPPLPDDWLALVEFAAAYYQRGIGELALAVLPPELRRLDDAGLARRQARWAAAAKRSARAGAPAVLPPSPPELLPEQSAALARIAQEGAGTTLLHGVTGSGKTEVYLRCVERALAGHSQAQALLLVPEINLTPQLEARVAQRFPQHRVVSLHSRLTPPQRLANWMAAHNGQAQVVLGTRLAVFTPLPGLALIVVDEEHDASYKQQEGARYSARDLAVWRGRQRAVPVLLGSATPSLESWVRAQQGRYALATMSTRAASPAELEAGAASPAPAHAGAASPTSAQAGAASPTPAHAGMPRLRLVDMLALPHPRGQPPVLAPALVAALQERLARGEQSLLLLNRRGYAPVLHCAACGWKSGCPNCSAWRVFHKIDRSLRCHHCGLAQAVPRACLDCGNLDIAPLGRGTEKLSEELQALLPQARVARIDADSTRAAGALDAQLAAVHAGEVDILVGTQMVAKGHDFRRMTLVAAVNPDAGLFSSDFRASERLFALLLQAAGRAGRSAAQASASEMWIQTQHPRHPLYAALERHDYAGHAQTLLAERQAAGLPPFSHLALLRADAKQAEQATAFLQHAAELAALLPEAAPVALYPAVPHPLARVANVERVQMLVESRSRQALQRFLWAWLPALHPLPRQHKGVIRWAVDVDPMAI
jgi:primosomal protein N' (replication factor Y) (superfamily II helicase)